MGKVAEETTPRPVERFQTFGLLFGFFLFLAERPGPRLDFLPEFAPPEHIQAPAMHADAHDHQSHDAEDEKPGGPVEGTWIDEYSPWGRHAASRRRGMHPNLVPPGSNHRCGGNLGSQSNSECIRGITRLDGRGRARLSVPTNNGRGGKRAAVHG